VYAYKYDVFWRDIGTVGAYYTTSMELICYKPPISLDGTWPILTCEDLEPVNNFPSSNIEHTLISPRCVIKGKVENSILSPGVWVDECATVRNSILLHKVFVGYHSVVDSCIVDEEVSIGKYCCVGFGKDHKKIEEYALLGKGITISSYTAVARGCKIMPYVNLAESCRKGVF
jgi:glucose-1-phosphate adenylyltransferase